MENYQELYNKILEELKVLESNDSLLKQKYDKAKKDYDDVQRQIMETGKTLIDLVQKRDLLIKSRQEKSTFILLTVLSFVFMLSFVLNLVILTPIVIMYINTLIEMTDFIIAVIGVGFYVFSIALSALLSVGLFKKMNIFFVDRAYTKTINSEEYKEIVRQIDEIKDMKQSLVLDEIRKKYVFEIAEEKYNISTEEINKRKECLDYIEYELNGDNKVSLSNNIKVRRKKK